MADSEILLVERTGHATYREYRVRIRVQDGESTVRALKDGKRVEESMPTDVAVGLWDMVFTADVDRIQFREARVRPPAPDASTFHLTFRVGATEHRMSIYDVDSLADTRYRDLIREILATAERYAAVDPEGTPDPVSQQPREREPDPQLDQR